MQVQHDVRAVDHRPDLPGPLELQRAARPVQRRGIPDPVDVLIDEARQGRLTRIEPLERREVDEAEGQPPARRHKVGRQQAVERDRTGDFVAVRQGQEHDMRPGAAGGATGETGDAGVTRNPVANIGCGEDDLEGRQRGRS